MTGRRINSVNKYNMTCLIFSWLVHSDRLSCLTRSVFRCTSVRYMWSFAVLTHHGVDRYRPLPWEGNSSLRVIRVPESCLKRVKPPRLSLGFYHKCISQKKNILILLDTLKMFEDIQTLTREMPTTAFTAAF